VYIYVRDESAVRVLDLTSMQEGIAPLEQDFLELIDSEEYTSIEVSFDMKVTESNSLALSYRPLPKWPRRTIEEWKALVGGSR
jgi:hypothetical protein